VLSEKRNVCFRLLKNQGFKDESMTKRGSYAIGTSTTLESNKSRWRNEGILDTVVKSPGLSSPGLME
jgi:hypothetical protein